MKVIVRLGLAVALVCVALMGASAQEVTPAKISIIPALSYPQVNTIHGLDLGILWSNAEEVKGVQSVMVFGKTATLTGVQWSFVNSANSLTGVQMGFYNGAVSVKGLQWGFINVCETMKGVQVGLVNVIKKSPILPVMVIINGNF